MSRLEFGESASFEFPQTQTQYLHHFLLNLDSKGASLHFTSQLHLLTPKAIDILRFKLTWPHNLLKNPLKINPCSTFAKTHADFGRLIESMMPKRDELHSFVFTGCFNGLEINWEGCWGLKRLDFFLNKGLERLVFWSQFDIEGLKNFEDFPQSHVASKRVAIGQSIAVVLLGQLEVLFVFDATQDLFSRNSIVSHSTMGQEVLPRGKWSCSWPLAREQWCLRSNERPSWSPNKTSKRLRALSRLPRQSCWSWGSCSELRCNHFGFFLLWTKPASFWRRPIPSKMSSTQPFHPVLKEAKVELTRSMRFSFSIPSRISLALSDMTLASAKSAMILWVLLFLPTLSTSKAMRLLALKRSLIFKHW